MILLYHIFRVLSIYFCGVLWEATQSVAADTIPTVFDSVKTMYNSVLKYFSLEDGGVITVLGVEKKGDINGNIALKKAFELGKQL